VYWHRAAAKWIGLSERMEELRHWRRIVELVDRLGDEASLRSVAEACWQICDLSWRGLPVSAEERSRLIDLSERLADRLGDNQFLLRALISHTTCLCIVDVDLRAARSHAMKIENSVATRTSPVLQVAAMHCRGEVLYFGGELSEAHVAFQREFELCDGDATVTNAGGQQAMAMALAYLAAVEQVMGKHGDAQARYDASIAALGTDVNPESEFFVHYMHANFAPLLYGVDQRIRRMVQHAVELSGRFTSPWFLRMARIVEGSCLLASGGTAAALDIFRSLLETFEGRFSDGYKEACAAMAARLEGDVEESCEFAREAVRVTAQIGHAIHSTFACIQLAESLVAAGEAHSPEVAECLARAESLIVHTGAEGFRPLLLEARFRWKQATGNPAGALADLHAAFERYRSSGAEPHASRLEALLPRSAP
jgi:tetratricopeptide (TPR) repeat protein